MVDHKSQGGNREARSWPIRQKSPPDPVQREVHHGDKETPARPSAGTGILFNHELHQSHESDFFTCLSPFV
jgi:hypothetical protein